MLGSATRRGLLPGLVVAVLLGAAAAPGAAFREARSLTGTCYGYACGPPTVTGVSPRSGPTVGGTTVTITGSAFTGATAVHFGTTSATTFTVNSDTQVTATSPAHAAGTVDVTVTTPLGTSAISASDQFTYANTCTSVTLSASPPSPHAVGIIVALTAIATCPHSNPQFEFWARWQGTSSWVVIQPYSTSNTFSWNTVGAAQGTDYLGVWVKDSTSPLAVDALTSIAYVVTHPACQTASLTASPTSVSQGSGAVSTLTGVAGSCSNANPLFEFWMRTASTGWKIIQPFSNLATYKWNSTGAPPGTVYFGLWVKDAYSAATVDAFASTTVTVTPAICSSVTLTAAPTSVLQGAGTHSTLTAAVSGCANSSGQMYEFWMRTASTGWVIVQPYSPSNTYDWNSTGAAPGTVYFGVWARDAKSTNLLDTFTSTTVTVTPAICSSVTVTAAPTSVVHGAGTPVTLTATASGCTNSTGQMYEFWMRTSSTGWVIVQSYSTSNTFVWSSTGVAPGTVYFGVWVKDANSTNLLDTFSSTTVTVT
jgi:IPT/TIG domain